MLRAVLSCQAKPQHLFLSAVQATWKGSELGHFGNKLKPLVKVDNVRTILRPIKNWMLQNKSFRNLAMGEIIATLYQFSLFTVVMYSATSDAWHFYLCAPFFGTVVTSIPEQLIAALRGQWRRTVVLSVPLLTSVCPASPDWLNAFCTIVWLLASHAAGGCRAPLIRRECDICAERKTSARSDASQQYFSPAVQPYLRLSLPLQPGDSSGDILRSQRSNNHALATLLCKYGLSALPIWLSGTDVGDSQVDFRTVGALEGNLHQHRRFMNMTEVCFAVHGSEHNKQLAVAKVPHGGDFLCEKVKHSCHWQFFVAVFFMHRKCRNLLAELVLPQFKTVAGRIDARQRESEKLSRAQRRHDGGQGRDAKRRRGLAPLPVD
ncbi:hypothetical protein F2P81_013096 [Scophthalmus maximus]|uniref:Uncharacterized protein n=1 Tax=Scophthalmus maximus TaxID=52904 RepID=A0A6A4ST47_SCOMX|nr:hypothetical protein F2P81_013096 [Scophthalmus maximus]